MRTSSFCLLAGLLLANAAAAPAAESQASSSLDEWVYTVRPGDNLWTLSRDHLLAVDYWKRLQALNHVADPWHVAPGTRLRMPFSWLRVQPAPARVAALSGTVTLTRAGAQEPTPASVGALVTAGDAVAAAAASSASVELADQSRLLVAASTRVVFDVLSAFGRTGMVDTRVRLERGRSESQVSPRRGRFTIASPAAVTVVRGTAFRASFSEEERTSRVEVTEGVVSAEAGGASVAVAEGFGTLARVGESPLAPVALLPAPDVTGLPALARLPLRLQLPALPGASGYRLQVSTDDRFQALALESESASGEFVVRDLPEGAYALRFRALDERGLAGRDAVARLELRNGPEPNAPEPVADRVVPEPRRAPPAAPALQSPGLGRGQLTLAWSSGTAGQEYRVQLARDQGFRNLVINEKVAEPRLTAKRPRPGRYYLRVRTIDADGVAGEFGPVQTIEIGRPRRGRLLHLLWALPPLAYFVL